MSLKRHCYELHVGHLALLEYCGTLGDFVVGEDWGANPHNIEVESYLKSRGKKIIKALYNPRTSSSQIKQNTIAQSNKRHYVDHVIA